ncbi:MAG: hypothetical protein EOO28_35030 [Comamonadaceae bacterium]|nr:MAG: hypothetical protein EOO28_35030 [Comamonadaceae bacterium]
MKRFLRLFAITIFGPTLLSSCGKEEPVEEVPAFDAKRIAAEADRGNIEPLKELNSACRSEVEKKGRRAGTCAIQDEVRRLSKPINIRF